MPQCQIVDTFPTFLDWWTRVKDMPLEAQIEAWAAGYMASWPELLEKQVADYAAQDLDWRAIARERVFPFLSDRLPAMETAHENLLELWAPICAAAWRVLGFEEDVLCVIYVGIGCGAGWATRFQGSAAVLFGLENIAECGWSERQPLSGLVAHELGHLVHAHWRAQHDRAAGSGPWWQLYEEGFVQRCEHLILGQESWHMNSGVAGEDWLDWCRENRAWLAAEFLRSVDAGQSVRPFFGSWYRIQGHTQCGYFLGHALVRQLERELDMREIALLEADDPRLRRALEELAM